MIYLPAETLGLVDLTKPAGVITFGNWFLVQYPNLLWYISVPLLVLLGIFVPFNTKPIDTAGYPAAGE